MGKPMGKTVPSKSKSDAKPASKKTSFPQGSLAHTTVAHQPMAQEIKIRAAKCKDGSC